MPTLESFGTGALNELVAIDSAPCVSVYLPTAESGQGTKQGRILLKNLLKEVETKLKARGLRWLAIAKLIGPAEELVVDLDFWHHQSEGLALFMADGVFRAFTLPISVPSRESVGENFDVAPLLPLLSNDGRFTILALSENAVRVFDATRFGCSEVKVLGMPAGLEETIPIGGAEKQQQRHGGAGGSPTYFGSGDTSGSKEHKIDLKRYFDRIDAAMTPYVAHHPAPVVLAGVAHLLPIYRTANTCATILDGEVHGNKDRTPAEELHGAGWEVAAPHFSKAQAEEEARFHELLGTGNASADPGEVEIAAEAGRVATLFVALQEHGEPSISRAAVATLSKGGTVFALTPQTMPAGESLAAIFRY